MSSSSIGLSENLLSYLQESGVKENKFQKMLRKETQNHPLAQTVETTKLVKVLKT